MEYHSLRLRITRNRDSLAVHHEFGGKGTKIPRQMLLFLAEDLSAFCVAMALQLTASQPQPAVKVYGANDIRLVSDDGKATEMEVELLSHKFCAMDENLQDLLLRPLKEVIGASMSVKISGHLVDAAAAGKVAKSMTTSLACSAAMLWTIYDHLSKTKDLADESVRNDQPGFACTLLDHLAGPTLGFTRRMSPFDGDRAVYYATCLLGCDVLLTRAHLSLAAGRFAQAEDFVADAQELLENPCLDEMGRPAELARVGYHLCTLLVFFRDRGWGRNTSFLDPTSGTVEVLKHVLSEGEGADAWQLDNAEVLGVCEDQRKRITFIYLPFLSSSFYAMPPRCINSRKSSAHCVKPACAAGWHDMRIINSSDQAAKDRLNALQAEGGFELTKFD